MASVLFIVYDNGSYIHFFPQGIAYLTSALEAEGHDVDIWHGDITHEPESAITAKLDASRYDIVGLGFIAGYYQYQVAQRIAEAVNASKNRKHFKFILGGHGPAAAPNFFGNKLNADVVFEGEAITTIVEYVNGETNIPINEPDIISCPTHHLINPDDFPMPAFDRFPIEIYRLIRWPTSKTTDFCFPILSGCGCTFKCSFCYRMDKGFRPRSPESCIEEMYHLWDNYQINHFQFSDELFMNGEARVSKFCETLLESKRIAKIRDFKWDCNGRLNYAKKHILALMRKAGCEYVNYGIESLEPEALKKMNKGLTVDQIHNGVEATIKAGMSPGINFMWGNPGDTADSLSKAVTFIIQYNPGHELRTIRPVTPYPGSPLFDEAIKRGLVDDVEDFYEKKHINSDLFSCNFMDISTTESHNLLYKANLKLMKHHYESKRMEQNAASFNCYMGSNNNFRGFRDV